MQKRFFTTFIAAHKLLTISIGLACLLIIAGFLSYITPQRLIDFKEFAPANGIKNVTLNVTAPGLYSIPLDFLPSRPIVSFDLMNNRGGVSEYKGLGISYTCPKLGTVIGEECHIGTSPKGQKFIRTLSYNPSNLHATPLVYDKLASQHASFERNGTQIGITLNLTNNTPASLEQWGDLIDSFEPTKLNITAVVRVHPGP